MARFAVSWAFIDEHGFANLDHVVELLDANGVRPLLTVSDAPPWAAPSAFVNGQFFIRPPDPEFDDEFAAFYATLAARYPRAILQVWSEPNLPFYGQIPPARYVELVEHAAAAVHLVNPRQRVIGAAPSPGDDAWRQYMRAVYSSISDPSIAVGVNLYPRRGRRAGPVVAKVEPAIVGDVVGAAELVHGADHLPHRLGLLGIGPRGLEGRVAVLLDLIGTVAGIPAIGR